MKRRWAGRIPSRSSGEPGQGPQQPGDEVTLIDTPNQTGSRAPQNIKNARYGAVPSGSIASSRPLGSIPIWIPLCSWAALPIGSIVPPYPRFSRPPGS